MLPPHKKTWVWKPDQVTGHHGGRYVAVESSQDCPACAILALLDVMDAQPLGCKAVSWRDCPKGIDCFVCAVLADRKALRAKFTKEGV